MKPDSRPFYFQTEFLAGLLFLIVSLVVISAAIVQIGQGFTLIENGVNTTGRVTAVTYQHRTNALNGFDRRAAPLVTISFTTRDGTNHSYSSGTFGSRPWPAAIVGQEVSVRYLPSNPAVFEVGPLGKADSAFILLIAGVVGLVSGIGLMVMARLGLARGLLSTPSD